MLLETFRVKAEYADQELPADYNMAPTKEAPVVVARKPQDGAQDAKPVHQLRNLKWGLVPFWAKNPNIGSRMINARAETLHEKPAFRSAFTSRRCLVPASGFYEWFPTERIGKSGKPIKQPYFIHPARDNLMTFAGLYEFWRNDKVPPNEPAHWLTTFVIITTNATDDVGHIHDRMPMSVTADNWEQWLDPSINDTHQLHALMAPPNPGSLASYPVTRAVNNVRNNGPQLLQPLSA